MQNLIAEIKISYSHKVKPSEQVKVITSGDAYNYVLPMWCDIDYRESFAVLLLSRSMKVLGLSWVSLGGVSGTAVDPKIIFQAALKANASAVILLHNHPSGILLPSECDRKLTTKIKNGGTFLDVTVTDHLIITSEAYYSFADEGFI